MMPPPDHQNPVDMHTSIMCINIIQHIKAVAPVEFDIFSPVVSYPPEVQIEELAAFATSKESPLINLVCILTMIVLDMGLLMRRRQCI
jgi:hypothetical protein